MPQDDSPKTLRDGSSSLHMSPDEGWWEDLTSLSARRRWSPQRRKDRAEGLRLLRRMNLAVRQGASPRTPIVDQDRVITVCSGIADYPPSRPIG